MVSVYAEETAAAYRFTRADMGGAYAVESTRACATKAVEAGSLRARDRS